MARLRLDPSQRDFSRADLLLPGDTRLSAGGRWIRTVGLPSGRDRLSGALIEIVSLRTRPTRKRRWDYWFEAGLLQRRVWPGIDNALRKNVIRWHQYLGECPPDRSRNPRCFNGLPYHCGFPQIKIVCQQIRGHSVHNFAVAKSLTQSLSWAWHSKMRADCVRLSERIGWFMN